MVFVTMQEKEKKKRKNMDTEHTETQCRSSQGGFTDNVKTEIMKIIR